MRKSPEIGSGHHTTYFRELDGRMGRWWSADPITFPHQSPYNTFDGNPIYYTDASGASVVSPECPTWSESSITESEYKVAVSTEISSTSFARSYVVEVAAGDPGVDDDRYYDRAGNLVKIVRNNLPDRNFMEYDEGDYSYQGQNYIQINSVETIIGDIKSGIRHNKWNGSIESLDLKDAREIALKGASAVTFGLGVAIESGRGGAMDYVDYFKDGTIVEIQGIYYNSHEALNLLWGASMSELGYPMSGVMAPLTATSGARLYHFYAYFAHSDRYADAGPINEPNHTLAIYMGYNLFGLTEDIFGNVVTAHKSGRFKMPKEYNIQLKTAKGIRERVTIIWYKYSNIFDWWSEPTVIKKLFEEW
ncbi:hypothetical protein [Saprospira grandis]|uniref:hypothetical protein n=1 Tax=Saprospira grandis TaxID=1008 RepID=UPI00030D6D26|nr:hypothetical protein [Saprospira grandis]